MFLCILTTTNFITEILPVSDLICVCKLKSYDSKGDFVPFFKRAIVTVWHEKQNIFLFRTGFLQCCKGFSVISIWYEVPIKSITTTSEVCFKANSHNTVWNLTKCYCVTSVDLFRIFPWQGKRLKIHFQCNSFCVVKSPLRRKKYNSLSYFQHIILISKLQKKGRLKCHTVTFWDFYLSCSLIWLCTFLRFFCALFARFACSKQEEICFRKNVTVWHAPFWQMFKWAQVASSSAK